MPYALTGTEITEAQLSALGGDFSGNNWREELEEVRTNTRLSKRLILKGIDTIRHYPNEAINSGPWPITASDGKLGMTAQSTTGFFSNNLRVVYHRPLARDEAAFVFGDISGTPKVTTEIDFDGFPIIYEEQFNGNSDENDKTRTFRANLKTAGKTGRLTGFATSFLNGPGAASLAVDCNVGHSIQRTDFGLNITIDGSVGSGEIRLKITNNSEFQWAGSKGAGGLSALVAGGGRLIWRSEETAKTSAIAINSRAPIYKITPPKASEIGLFHPDGDEVDKLVGSFPVTFYRNMGVIYHDVSPEILRTGLDNFRGVWLCKTLVVGDVGVGADLAPNSSAPTNASTSGAWDSVSTAIEYQIPRYHFRRNTNGMQPATPVGERPPLGSCITSIFLRRAPVLSGDYYVENPATSAVTVRLGHAKSNGTFEPHQTATLAAGEVQKYVELEQGLWPILSHDYLLYDCDSLMDVQAVICSPLDMVPFNGEGSAAVTFPIMPWHYEDTERLQAI